MISQTRSEFYKLSRSLIILIMMFVLIILNVFISSRNSDNRFTMQLHTASTFTFAYSEFKLESVKKIIELPDSQATDLGELFLDTHPRQFQIVLSRNLGMMLIMMIFASYFIGMEFKSRSFNNALYVGRSRSIVFFAKVLSYYFAVALMGLVSILLLTQFYASAVFTNLPSSYVLRCIFTRVLLDMGIMSLPMLFAFLAKGPAISGILSLIYSGTMLAVGPTREGFFSFDPNIIKQLPALWTQEAASALIGKSVLVPLGFIVVCVLLGWLHFYKMELK